VNVFVAFCLLLTAGAFGYVRWKFGQFDIVDFGQGILRKDRKIDAMNILLVGSDTRETASGQEKNIGNTKLVGGQRSDTMMVLHIDPAAEKAKILSIPRDLWVTVYSSNGDEKGKQRINTAFEEGADALVMTITKSLGIPIDHYMEVDFNGFRGIVGAIGGVTMPFSSPARDLKSGLDVKKAGCVTLTPDQALAYVRSRNYQYLENGRWKFDPTADLGRIDRQQNFIRRVLRKALSQRNPLNLNKMVDVGIDNVSMDQGLKNPGLLLDVGKRFKSLEPGKVEMLTVPTKLGKAGKASVLFLIQPEAQELFDRFNGAEEDDVQPGTVPNILPNEIKVRVLNGSGVNGQAAEVANDLKSFGFVLETYGSASTFKYIQPEIRYGTGQKAKALVVQAYVKGGAKLVLDPTIRGFDVVLITGSGYSGLAKPGAPAPSTTVPPSTVPPAKSPTGVPAPLDC
jgi:polyisoprenyl-teichoic acid--peptidoglycan teichoic acid transferase